MHIIPRSFAVGSYAIKKKKKKHEIFRFFESKWKLPVEKIGGVVAWTHRAFQLGHFTEMFRCLMLLNITGRSKRMWAKFTLQRCTVFHQTSLHRYKFNTRRLGSKQCDTGYQLVQTMILLELNTIDHKQSGGAGISGQCLIIIWITMLHGPISRKKRY